LELQAHKPSLNYLPTAALLAQQATGAWEVLRASNLGTR